MELSMTDHNLCCKHWGWTVVAMFGGFGTWCLCELQPVFIGGCTVLSVIIPEASRGRQQSCSSSAPHYVLCVCSSSLQCSTVSYNRGGLPSTVPSQPPKPASWFWGLGRGLFSPHSDVKSEVDSGFKATVGDFNAEHENHLTVTKRLLSPCCNI